VRTDCYNDCCRCCCLRPICVLRAVHRMLDCLLPCNKCCGCGPAHGCLLGGRCGVGCGPSCCSSCAGPGLGEPFLDDPPVPQPLRQRQAKPQPTSQSTGAEVRLAPRRTSSLAMQPVVDRPVTQASPWKVSGESAASRSRSNSAATSRPSQEPVTPAR